MRLGCQRNGLAWLLVNANQPQTVEKENRGYPQNGSPIQFEAATRYGARVGGQKTLKP